MRLIDQRTPDGSRQFACLRAVGDRRTLNSHVLQLSGAESLQCAGSRDVALRLDFHFRRHCFLATLCHGLLRLFVRDPQCPDLILYEVLAHFERLSEPPVGDGLGEPA
ncbi:MAG: hypothetical protein LLF97_01755 [Planctomycetaceae bacterium]|nr:hypothetical protein [Planctomycetaceae bacterium]